VNSARSSRLRVDDGARARRGLLDRSDVGAAIPADHKLGGARAKPVELHLRPIAGADADGAVGIVRRVRVVGNFRDYVLRGLVLRRARDADSPGPTRRSQYPDF
jgi:hypothetical protein